MRSDPNDRYPGARSVDALAQLRAVATPEVAPSPRERRRHAARRAEREPRKPLPWPIVVVLVFYRFVFIMLGTVVTSALTLSLLGWSAWRYLERSMPPEVIIPDVSGKAEPRAREFLGAVGLEMATESVPDKHVPEGRVIDLSPHPGRRVSQGRTIKVRISTGPELVTVPRLVGETFASAQDMLQRLGLKVGATGRKTDRRLPAGTVLSQNPGPGRRIDTGAKVDLFVSSGPPPDEDNDREQPPATEVPTRPEPEVPAPEDGEPTERRIGTVLIPVPSNPALSSIRIVVRDENGEHTVYDAIHHAGDVVRQTVRGAGTSTVEVYINDRKVKEQDL